MGYWGGQGPGMGPGQGQGSGTGSGQEGSFSLDARNLQLEKEKQAQQAAKEQRMLSQGLNADGSPIAPEWGDLAQGGIVDEEGGLLPQYALKENILDTSQIAGFNQFQEFATGEGLSQWGEAATERLGVEESQQREGAIRQGQSATAQAQSQLAMRGGLSSGERERVAAGGAKDVLKARQGVSSQAMLGRADIGMQDAAAKQAALEKFVGVGADIEQFNIGQRTGTEQFNIETALGELGSERQFELDKYGEATKKYAAEKKSEAQIAACFALGTKIKMRDGSEKNVEDVTLGDDVYGGGSVYATYIQAWQGPLYDYEGVLVTGSHPVKEGNCFVRVKNSARAILSKEIASTVYDFSCVNHRIVIGDTTFTDYAEIDDPTLGYEQSLMKLNEKKVGDVAVC